MVKLIVLGTASAVPDMNHENTHFVLTSEAGSILVDCVGTEILRLERAGVQLEDLNHIILTHCHPDHISGLPALLLSMWLLGRRKPLGLYGLSHTLNCIEQMMELYEWRTWPDFFPVEFCHLPAQEMAFVLENQDLRIFSSPVRHIIPTIGLRIESKATGKAIAYSCDTEPCVQVEKLAEDVEILLHEATGQHVGHSSSAQAGGVANRSGTKRLYLIHYPPNLYGSQDLLDQAILNYSGEVLFAEDFQEFIF